MSLYGLQFSCCLCVVCMYIVLRKISFHVATLAKKYEFSLNYGDICCVVGLEVWKMFKFQQILKTITVVIQCIAVRHAL